MVPPPSGAGEAGEIGTGEVVADRIGRRAPAGRLQWSAGVDPAAGVAVVVRSASVLLVLLVCLDGSAGGCGLRLRCRPAGVVVVFFLCSSCRLRVRCCPLLSVAVVDSIWNLGLADPAGPATPRSGACRYDRLSFSLETSVSQPWLRNRVRNVTSRTSCVCVPIPGNRSQHRTERPSDCSGPRGLRRPVWPPCDPPAGSSGDALPGGAAARSPCGRAILCVRTNTRSCASASSQGNDAQDVGGHYTTVITTVSMGRGPKTRGFEPDGDMVRSATPS